MTRLTSLFAFLLLLFAALTTTHAASENPQVTSPSQATATIGVLFKYQITATNNPTSFRAENKPSWLSLNTSTGLLSGTPTASGAVNMGVGASNASGGGPTWPLTITVNSGNPQITSPSTATAAVGSVFKYQITATNNPTSFRAENKPSWLNLNTTTGLLSGTPTAAGIVSMGIGAYNANGGGPTWPLTITVNGGNPEITSPPTATAVVGSVFKYQITATNNPTSFRAENKPSWLNLNTTTGLLSGTPTAAGIVSMGIGAYNANGGGPTASLKITVQLPYGGAPINSTISLRSKANEKLVCADLNYNPKGTLIANRTATGTWEQFDVLAGPNNNIVLKARAGGYVTTGTSSLIAKNVAASELGKDQYYQWIQNADGTISLRAVKNNMYVCAENSGAAPLVANRSGIGQWEKFSFVLTGKAGAQLTSQTFAGWSN